MSAGSHLGILNPATGDFETIFGELAPATAAQRRRCEAFDHPKPGRPADEKLLEVLDTYRERAPKGRKGLPLILGITRTSRYRAVARRFKGRRGTELRPTPAGVVRRPAERERLSLVKNAAAARH